MITAFRYPEEEWQAIKACLVRLASNVGDEPDTDALMRWRHSLEAIAHNFSWLAKRTDPRSPEVIKASACWAKLAEHLEAADAALAELEAMDTQPIRSLRFAIADDALAQDVEYAAWKAKIKAAAKFATTAARGHPKSLVWVRDENGRPIRAKVGPNRARGDLVNELLGNLLAFWIDRGGQAGVNPKSPSTQFIVAAAGRILSDIIPGNKLPGAIVSFVRDRNAKALCF